MFATGLRLRDYRWGWLRADVIAGVTVAAYLVPQAMAYARLAGLPAVTGLWAVLGMLFSSARWTPRLPAPLLVMVLAAAVTALAGLGQRGVALIGGVPSGLPSPAPHCRCPSGLPCEQQR